VDEQSRVDPERERIRAAVVSLVGERGYLGTTLDRVRRRADLDLASFRSHYADFDDCFTAVWESIADQFIERAAGAYLSGADWRGGIRALAWEYCRFLAEDQDRARVFMVEVAFGNEAVRAARDVVMERYIDLVHLGAGERPDAAGVPRTRAEAVIGAIWERVAVTVKAGRFEQLPEQVPQMMYVLVLPYLGAAAAQQELRRGPVDIARYERGEL
jgi:AcrR family transcriptional regulator